MRWSGFGGSGNVEDRRGMRPVAVGGGVVGLIIVVLGMIFGVDLRQFAQVGGGGGLQMQQVGPAPDDKTKEFVGAVLLFTEEVWTDEFRKMGKSYEKPKLVLFTEAVATDGCGNAPSAVGPFYCP